jgi:hypothetical protein
LLVAVRRIEGREAAQEAIKESIFFETISVSKKLPRVNTLQTGENSPYQVARLIFHVGTKPPAKKRCKLILIDSKNVVY